MARFCLGAGCDSVETIESVAIQRNARVAQYQLPQTLTGYSPVSLVGTSYRQTSARVGFVDETPLLDDMKSDFIDIPAPTVLRTMAPP